MATSSWAVERVTATPRQLHADADRPLDRRSVRICEATDAALVLGSVQPDDTVDLDAAARLGVAVVRRRTGGGAVLVEPGRVVWVDVTVPAGDPLHDDDVGRAFHWLGDAWARALATLGIGTSVHKAGLVSTRWSRIVCFAGVGPGEVLDRRGRKVVGLAQRRARGGALFQCAALLAWDADRLAPLVRAAPADLAGVAAPVTVGQPDQLIDSFLRELPEESPRA